MSGEGTEIICPTCGYVTPVGVPHCVRCGVPWDLPPGPPTQTDPSGSQGGATRVSPSSIGPGSGRGNRRVRRP